eukprot:gb/GFBE01065526.1/.p1 GENE.gb/GFBE01065526.1/~~gb/GFBE01065526.1/.p1  ORF type:complete len:193 (+),score=23.79 gb/GFBE01065526.1/:1-579(+)
MPATDSAYSVSEVSDVDGGRSVKMAWEGSDDVVPAVTDEQEDRKGLGKVVIGTSVRQKWLAEMGNLRVTAALIGGFSLGKFDPKRMETALETTAAVMLFIAFHTATFAAVVTCLISARLTWRSDDDKMPPSWVMLSPRAATTMAVCCYILGVAIFGAADSGQVLVVVFISVAGFCLTTLGVITATLWKDKQS